MSFILLFLLLLCLLFKIWYNRYKFNKTIKGFIAPPGSPLFGHFHIFSPPSKLEANLLDITRTHGTLLKMEFFYGQPFLLVTDRDFLNYIMTVKPMLARDALYEFSKRFLGEGLGTCQPTKWKKSRKMLNPAFNAQLLEEYVEVFGGPCDELIERLKEEVGNDGFDVFSYTYLCALDIICETIMGIKLNVQTKENPHSQFVEDNHAMTRIAANRLLTPLKRFNLTYIFTSEYWEGHKVAKRLHSFTRKVIEERRVLRKTSAINGGFSIGVSRSKKRPALIDILLDAKRDGEPISDEDIMYEILIFLFAGHDTAATVVATCLYCLSKYPDIQDKVFKELRSILGNDKRYPTWSDLGEMRYLEMVIKETLRLYTPAPIISKLIDEDIQYGDIFVPKGISALIYLQGVHMNPDYFTDPEKFDPSRFESEPKPFSFIPFSAGPRNCIGQRFGMLEIKYTICQVLRSFVILPVPGHMPQRIIHTILRLKNGAMIKLKPRQI